MSYDARRIWELLEINYTQIGLLEATCKQILIISKIALEKLLGDQFRMSKAIKRFIGIIHVRVRAG